MVCTAEAAKCVVHLGRSYPREDLSCSGPVPTAKTTLNPAHVRPERRALHNEPRLDDHQAPGGSVSAKGRAMKGPEDRCRSRSLGPKSSDPSASRERQS